MGERGATEVKLSSRDRGLAVVEQGQTSRGDVFMH